MTFTESQQQAIDARENKILVAAAAGSGKTAVLVQRILTLIVDEAIDVDKLLIVTFTEAAAAEMKERINDALDKLIEESPDDANLLRQSARLPLASISTIHAFCRRLVKDHFNRLDLDPSFRVGDQTELNLLQSQVMEALFEESYAADEDSSFSAMVEIFGGGKTRDIRLDKLIRRIFDFIQSRPFPEKAVEEYLALFDNLEPWLDVIKEEIGIALDAALDAVERARKLCTQPNGPEKYLLTLQDDEDIIRRLQKTESLDDCYEAFSQVSFPRIYTYRGKEKEEIDEDLREQAKDIRGKDIKKRVEQTKSRFLFASPDKMRKDMENLRPIVQKLFDITLDYRNRYSAEKRKRNLLDFNDLEHFAIQLLWEDGEASSVAQSLSDKYAEVLTDEYQDTNEVQEWILSAIDTRRFMVGDVKQSIYGFRHANPGLFMDKLKQDDVQAIILSKNFRSRQEVLSAVNFFFYRLMSIYDDDAALHYGASFEDSNNCVAEIHVVEAIESEEEDYKTRQEARMIAERIKSLNYPGKDIVILTRTRAVTALTESLKQQDINAVSDSPGGFFEAPEIMMALSLLQIIDNPRQDIALLTVLRLYDFTPDELLVIRQMAEGDFYDCLLVLQEERRIASFLEDLNRWRKKAIVLPISRLIGVVYEETGLMSRYGAMSAGAVRQANLQLLLEKAIQYETTSFTGLFHFVRYAEWLQGASDESAAMLLPADDSVVRVMTVHQSKGLEFPVVFVSMLGRQFNKMDERAGVILHPKLGLGAMYTDLELRTRANTLPRLALSLSSQGEMVSEELRVLYVAMTRAKEKLILTGSVSDASKWRAASGALPAYALREAKSYLDWLMPCVLDSEEHVTLYMHKGIPEGDHAEVSLAPAVAPPDVFDKAETEELPSKLAISELKRIFALETSPDSVLAFEDENIFEAPAFYKTATGQVSPMRMGTLLHTVVEHMSLEREQDIKALIDDLVARGLMSQEEADVVDVGKLERFANSDLAERMRKARHLYREVPFVIGLNPEDVYGEPRDGTILVHGIIDCYFETAEGDIVLVDFKNDAKYEALHTRYATQMKIYQQAIKQATGKPVTESVFYSFRKDDIV